MFRYLTYGLLIIFIIAGLLQLIGNIPYIGETLQKYIAEAIVVIIFGWLFL